MKRIAPVFVLAAAVLAFSIYLMNGQPAKVESKGSMAAFLKHPAPKDIAPFSFTDSAGATTDLSAFKGKVTLLNLWATWCAPCRKEMPELAKLHREMGGADFQVVALSQDAKGYEASAKFMKEAGADNIPLYADEKLAGIAAFSAPGLPVTVLISRDGKELGRLIGPAPWDSDEAKALIKSVADVK